MKKLLVFSFLFLISLQQITAQKNNLSLFAGPEAVYFLSDEVVEPAKNAPAGYSIGLELARKMSAQWQFKVGIRYCGWKMPILAGPVQWPSENDGNGQYQYDPSLAHYIITDFSAQKAWQLLPGFRWQSGTGQFHWIANGEIGFTRFLKNTVGIDTRLRPTTGLAFGAEWSPFTHWHFFAQPGGWVILRDFKNKNIPESHLLNLELVLGSRYSF